MTFCQICTFIHINSQRNPEDTGISRCHNPFWVDLFIYSLFISIPFFPLFHLDALLHWPLPDHSPSFNIRILLKRKTLNPFKSQQRWLTVWRFQGDSLSLGHRPHELVTAMKIRKVKGWSEGLRINKTSPFLLISLIRLSIL